MRTLLPVEVYQSLFINSADGQAVLEELSAYFYDVQSYTKGDPYETAYREGQRSVIRHILKKLATLPITGDNDE